MVSSRQPGQRPFETLRRLMRPHPASERCELCGAMLASEHQHLLERAGRRLHCCCDACAILFASEHSARYRRVPRRLEALPAFRMTDAQWDSLRIPINLAFFFQDSASGKVVALYPSPAGATESLLPLEAWHELARENPVLQELEPEVEALLVNRVGQARDYYRLPIDECYKLVGIVRTHWRGLAGGQEAWAEIGRFFGGLQRRCAARGGPPHA